MAPDYVTSSENAIGADASCRYVEWDGQFLGLGMFGEKKEGG